MSSNKESRFFKITSRALGSNDVPVLIRYAIAIPKTSGRSEAIPRTELQFWHSKPLILFVLWQWSTQRVLFSPGRFPHMSHSPFLFVTISWNSLEEIPYFLMRLCSRTNLEHSLHIPQVGFVFFRGGMNSVLGLTRRQTWQIFSDSLIFIRFRVMHSW